jgi:YD repeat-containing protein
MFFLMGLAAGGFAQYYYKDIVSTKQNMDKWKLFKQNRVKQVQLSSFDGAGQPAEGFEVRQEVAEDFSSVTTFTHSNMAAPSVLIAFYDGNGRLKKTLDTSDTYQSTTEYEYDPAGRIVAVTNLSLETDNQVKDSEKHLWEYNTRGTPMRMWKIKNGSDSTHVEFIADSSGNVAEERATHSNQSLPVIYYYYNDAHELTDVVRYNERAGRMLPDYIYDYDAQGKLASMLFVPEGSTDYQKWLYQYDAKGLEQLEVCYDKKKQLMGKIQYEYSFY